MFSFRFVSGWWSFVKDLRVKMNLKIHERSPNQSTDSYIIFCILDQGVHSVFYSRRTKWWTCSNGFECIFCTACHDKKRITITIVIWNDCWGDRKGAEIRATFYFLRKFFSCAFHHLVRNLSRDIFTTTSVISPWIWRIRAPCDRALWSSTWSNVPHVNKHGGFGGSYTTTR